jgi:hypothetical protein
LAGNRDITKPKINEVRDPAQLIPFLIIENKNINIDAEAGMVQLSLALWSQKERWVTGVGYGVAFNCAEMKVISMSSSGVILVSETKNFENNPEDFNLLIEVIYTIVTRYLNI